MTCMRVHPSTRIEFPLRLQCSLDAIVLGEGLHLLPMDEPDRFRLLRIKDVEFDKEGKLKKCTSLPGSLMFGPVSPMFDIYDEFCSSNFILCAQSAEHASVFNLALKLSAQSRSSLYIGYEGKDTTQETTHYLTPCYFGSAALSLDRDGLR